MNNQATAKALSRFPDGSRPAAEPDATAEAKKRSWLERKDEAMSEKVELSKGSLWLIGTLMVLAGLAFNYGGSLLGWSRDDAIYRQKLEAITADVKEIKEAMRKFELREAEKRGYELKAAEGDHGQPQPKQEQRK